VSSLNKGIEQSSKTVPLALKVTGVLLISLSLTACQLTPKSTKVYSVPSFPPLALEDHPIDPRGFCISGDEAAKLALYINQLENLAKDK